MTDYIILRNSVEQAAYQANPAVHQGKKFKVVFGNGFQESESKNEQQADFTLGGTLDLSSGYVFYRWRGVLRVYYTPTAAAQADGFGSYHDLRVYHRYNNPLGSPSNLITLVDHAGINHIGYLLGDFTPEPVVTSLTGAEAQYFIPVQFAEREAVA